MLKTKEGTVYSKTYEERIPWSSSPDRCPLLQRDETQPAWHDR
jgi:hypothetical protein